jgi:predicted  nucleic acid-binding Zn-ribbon protein
MEEQLSLLIQLQEIDLKVRLHTEQNNRLPEALAALERRRAASQEDIEKVKGTLLEAQKNKRDRDNDLEVAVQKVEKLKTRSSEIKNNKEYQAILKEIESAELECKTIEDDILKLMEKIDNAALQITAAEQRAQNEDVTILTEQKQHEAASVKLGDELQAMGQARKQLVSRISPPVLSQYQKLLISRGFALAEARGESCSGCYMSIPPQVFVNVKKNENIITCPHCNRILYFKEVIKST